MAKNKKKYKPVNKKKRRLIVALSILAGLILIAGIWILVANYDPSPVKSGKYDTTIVATLSYTDDNGKVYTHDVTYAEVRYYVKERKLTPNKALEAVANDWVPEVMSEMYKVGLTVSDVQQLEAELEEYKNVTSIVKYEAALEGQYMTVDLHHRFLELKYLTARVRVDLTETTSSPILKAANKDDVLKFLNETFYAARHIYIPKETGADAKIQDAYTKLQAGTSFAELLAEYNKDTAMTDKGIIFVEDAMVEDYMEAVKALKEGETSAVLELSKGYFIIERLEPNALILENYDSACLTYAVDVYHHVYADIQCDIQITTEPIFDKIDSSIR